MYYRIFNSGLGFENVEATIIKHEQYDTPNTLSKIGVSYAEVTKLNNKQLCNNLAPVQPDIAKQIIINTTNHGYSSSAAQDTSMTHKKDIFGVPNPNLSMEHKNHDYVEKPKINNIISQSHFVSNHTNSTKPVAIAKVCTNSSSTQKMQTPKKGEKGEKVKGSNQSAPIKDTKLSTNSIIPHSSKEVNKPPKIINISDKTADTNKSPSINNSCRGSVKT